MASEFTVTRAKNAGERDNPHGGTLVKWYVDLDGPDGEVKDVYAQKKPGNDLSIGDKIYGRIEEGEYGPRFFGEQNPNGGGGGSRSGGSRKDDLGPEFWAAKDKRIGRAGMLQAVVIAHGDPGEFLDVEGYIARVNGITDALIASLDAVAPPPNASVPTAASPAPSGAASGSANTEGEREGGDSAATGFASEKQEAHFRRMLKTAGGSDATVGFVTWYAKENLSPSLISEALDGLSDEATRQATAKALAVDANAWSIKTGNTQPDTSDLPEAA